MKKLLFIFFGLNSFFSAHTQAVNVFGHDRLDIISQGLNNFLFVSRFESVETPCLYIDPKDSSKATAYAKNSNYRKRLADSLVVDDLGVKCLSNYCAKYIRFKTASTNDDSLIIRGEVEMTYGYPAAAIMQMLCITNDAPGNDSVFFKKMIKSKGLFKMYPEKSKYVISMIMQKEPFDPRDTVYGYLEIVKDFFGTDNTPSFHFIFDHISLYKGDKNNPLSLGYTSTTHRQEMIYYTEMVRDILQYRSSTEIKKRAYAVWLANYFESQACLKCNLIYKPASDYYKTEILPNTQPQPAH